MLPAQEYLSSSSMPFAPLVFQHVLQGRLRGIVWKRMVTTTGWRCGWVHRQAQTQTQIRVGDGNSLRLSLRGVGKHWPTLATSGEWVAWSRVHDCMVICFPSLRWFCFVLFIIFCYLLLKGVWTSYLLSCIHIDHLNSYIFVDMAVFYTITISQSSFNVTCLSFFCVLFVVHFSRTYKFIFTHQLAYSSHHPSTHVGSVTPPTLPMALKCLPPSSPKR